ncbi:MAG: hemerythrin family protein [Acetobacteraceae bacterium]
MPRTRSASPRSTASTATSPALIDQLSAALKDGGERQSIVDGLDALIRFTTFHFATEERLMGAHRLVGQERHREEHRRLLQDICNLNVDGEVASISLILRYLREWLLRHIDSLDRHLGQALLAKGCQ